MDYCNYFLVLTESKAFLDLLEQMHFLFARHFVLGTHHQLTVLHGQNMSCCSCSIMMIMKMLLLMMMLVLLLQHHMAGLLHIVGWYIR